MFAFLIHIEYNCIYILKNEEHFSFYCFLPVITYAQSAMSLDECIRLAQNKSFYTE